MELTKILIIDDTVSILEVLKDLFEFENYDVYTESNSQTGIDRAIEINPHLIICDVMMPKKNGFEVYVELKANTITQNIPILFVTADVFVETKMLDYGITSINYILKPFNLKNVLNVVGNTIANNRSLC